ncbi:hypothetical protein FACS189459_1700 [Bacilli bacterium]|nr:hypothetical protein FACS189459_1700 [Bacilli bacterium]
MQELSTQKNLLSSKISSLINKDVNNEIATIKEQVLVIKSKMEELTKTKENLDKEMHEVLFSIPNIPDSSVPIGKDENDNIEIRKFLEPTKFNFDAKPH